jgi:Protein of unknown function (DUF1588)/Protein of unknown function (DUF1592)/Protein of unknown function (DUF1585)/Protein of unknown function (DUF1587)
VEYATTIKDWLGITVDVSNFLPDGTTVTGMDTISAVLSISKTHVTNFEQAATAVVDQLFREDPGGIRAKWCSYATGDQAKDEACAATIVSDFAERAWRRPHSTWRGNDGLPTYQAGLKATGRFGSVPLEGRLKQVLTSILVGPRFLLRVELKDANGRLDAPSIASRLSYLLWSSAPDAQTVGAALQDEAALRAELLRLQFSGASFDAKFERFLTRFPDIWLQLGQLASVKKDEAAFPNFTAELKRAMRAETLAYFRGFIGVGTAAGPPLSQLLTQKTTPSDPLLQAIYQASPRAGLLTQASFLSLTSVSARTSAVRRGKWVMERLLCEPPPPPPAALADEINAKVAAADQTAVERERLAQHRADLKCNACHQTMDVIGLGLENYGVIGKYRSQDGAGHTIDPSGTLPGSTQAFKDGVELSNVLAGDPRVARCIAQQLLTYGTGREYGGADSALLDSIVAAAGGPEATFEGTLQAVVLSPAFRATEGKP